MLPTGPEPLVHDIRFSTVVPASVTGETKVHELTNMDLAMKLHYIKGLYFFNSEAVRGTTIFDFKKPMFYLLDLYYPASGRIRLSEKGRPSIKCNDGGVRIVEANCSKTLDEWLAIKDRHVDDQLVYAKALGPDLGFSPLVFIQITWFKCGGLSVGLSWAHILGDAFSASAFINTWGLIMAGHMPPQPLTHPNNGKFQFPHSTISQKQIPLKRVPPVGDRWLTSNASKMETFSFHMTPEKTLSHIISSNPGLNQVAKQQYFQVIAAVMWKSLAKIREGLDSETKVVTICTTSSSKGNQISSNSQVIGTVEAGFNVEEAEISELAKLIDEKMVDERSLIEELVGRENGESDFIVYGARLTFVNLEGENIYGLQIQGKNPVFVNYSVDGIGEGGVVLVLLGPENSKEGGSDERTVTVTVPENQIVELKNELRKEWGILIL